MRKSYRAISIDADYQRRKRQFIKVKCMKCKNKMSEKCNIIKTPLKNLQCNGFEEV